MQNSDHNVIAGKSPKKQVKLDLFSQYLNYRFIYTLLTKPADDSEVASGRALSPPTVMLAVTE